MKRSGPCFFREFGWGPCIFRADGQPDPAHLIPKQRLKAAGVTDPWNPTLLVPACRRHHDTFDRKMRPVPLDAYPASLIEWAEEHNWFYVDSRTGWRAAAVAEHSA
jgi:hypothetical protein